MHFKRVISALAFVTLASAQCETGTLLCCNSLQSSSSAGSVAGLLGIVLQDTTGLVGLSCSPISAIGNGATPCTAQAVCCSNNSFNGLIAFGCTPANVNM